MAARNDRKQFLTKSARKRSGKIFGQNHWISQKFKMVAINCREMIVKKRRMTLLYIVSEMYEILCFMQKFRIAAKMVGNWFLAKSDG